MSVKVLFFASYREALGLSEIQCPLDHPTSLASFKQELINQHGEAWGKVLTAANLVQAVNQAVVGDEHQLAVGDEVAFFPPVTGG